MMNNSYPKWPDGKPVLIGQLVEHRKHHKYGPCRITKSEKFRVGVNI